LMEFTAGQIAAMLGGELRGDAECKVQTYSKIEEGFTGSISFLANPKYEAYLYDTQASVVIVGRNFEPKQTYSTTLILVDNPYLAFTTLLDQYKKLTQATKIGFEQPHFIDPSTIIGSNCYIGAFVYIGKNCQIGNHCKIWPQVYIGDGVTIGNNADIQPGVKIYANTKIGENCVIKANAVVGSEGFGFALQENGTYKNIPQLGNVIIGNNVNIGANTTIDCATMGATTIANGVKLDNLIQIAHNVEIGNNSVLVAQSGVAGSAKIGEDCIIGGQAAIVGHINLANGTKVGGQSGVTKTIKKPNTAVNGTPAHDYNENMKSAVIFRKLPDLMKDLEKLKNK
jgi:UDP-3-O-[3-hydroxymyristoyl] glucosamine N-acyltransferase